MAVECSHFIQKHIQFSQLEETNVYHMPIDVCL